MMKKHVLALSALLVAASTVPAMAERPVEAWELGGFVGKTVKGHAQAPLGIVGAVDKENGIIAMVGPQGQIATVHTSMLVSTGSDNLRAPLLTIGDIAYASNTGRSNVPFIAPSITVGEPDGGSYYDEGPYYDEYGRPLYDEYGEPLYYDY